jgi:tRNA(adenine34) deaminase
MPLPPLEPAQAERWMREALAVAREALLHDEVPVGCLIFDADGKELARSFDCRQGDADPLAHAEWLALRQAGERQGDWRLDGMTLVVTLEPCPMCAGAILLARIPMVVFGAADAKAGAVRTLYQLLEDPRLNHRCLIVPGVLADACGRVLSEFFQQQRQLGKK